jgi:hypothetical protein
VRSTAQGAVGQHHPVAQDREVERHAAAVRAARDPHLLAVDHAGVGQQARQLLDVARLVAHVVQAHPAPRAADRVGQARRRAAARLAEAARAEGQHRVAALRPRLHVLVAELGAAVAMGEDHQRQARARRQGEVGVERDAVEGLDLALAQPDPIALVGARQAERIGGPSGRRRCQRGEEEHHDPEASHGGCNG